MGFEIEWETDTGPEDGCFVEWWNVRLDGRLVARAETAVWADKIVDALSRSPDLVAEAQEDASRPKKHW